MNKVLGSILVVVLTFVVGSTVLAAGPITGCTIKHSITTASTTYDAGTPVSENNPDEWGTVCLLDSVYNVTDWIFYGLLSLVSVFTIYGGFLIVKAGDNAEDVGKGRQYVVFATVGLIVAFLSKLIPSIAQGIIGVSQN